jgi:multicomponent Na+:H+ antiporter subunit B
MRSLILTVVAQVVVPVTTVFAVYLLLRGHNEPGGGFIAGLVTVSAIVLRGLAFGEREAGARLGHLRHAIPLGLVVAMASALPALLWGGAYFTHIHGYLPVPGLGAVPLSTALIFDIGVYLVVVGTGAGFLTAFVRGAES